MAKLKKILKYILFFSVIIFLSFLLIKIFSPSYHLYKEYCSEENKSILDSLHNEKLIKIYDYQIEHNHSYECEKPIRFYFSLLEIHFSYIYPKKLFDYIYN